MSKEQERAELHRTIWQIANDFRGSVIIHGDNRWQSFN